MGRMGGLTVGLMTGALVLASTATATASPAPRAFDLTVNPARAAAGAPQAFRFEWTAEHNVNKAQASLTIPTGWPAPQLAYPGQPGFVRVSEGECDLREDPKLSGSGPWTIAVLGIKCKAGRSFAVRYSASQTRAGVYEFAAQASTQDGAAAVRNPLVTVVPGPADHLAFTAQPPNGVAGDVLTPAPAVAVFDAWGNPVGDGNEVALAVGSGPTHGVLSGTTTQLTSAGVATFGDLSLNKVGSYSLSASAAGLSAVTSNSFTVSHATTDSFSLGLSPSSLVADGSSTSTAVATVIDRFGNPVSGDPVAITTSGDATVGPVTDNGDGTYTATITASTTVDTETITASDAGLVASQALSEHPGPPAVLLLSTPSALSANGTDSTSVTATLTDQWGNRLAGEPVAVATAGDSTVGPTADNGDGTYTATITASTTWDTETITASVAGLNASASLVEAPIGCPLAEYVGGGSAYAFGGTGSTEVQLELTPVGGTPFTVSTGQAVIATDSTFNQGWWSPTLGNTTDNDNFLAGTFSIGRPACMHSYFTFDLTGISGPIASARLVMADPGGGDGPAALALHLWDVSTPATTLNHTAGRSQAIYDDLGSGVAYGSYAVAPSAMPTTYDLDAAAVADINGSSGYFSIGASLTD